MSWGRWRVIPAARSCLHLARAVVLATGGIGQAYRHTTNPPENTGDGLAMAARVGARLADLEFVQFHPTALDVGADPMPLLTEALRGAGATLVDDRGRRFMPGFHPAGELAPRDVVARALWEMRRQGRRTLLDARDAVGSRVRVRLSNRAAALSGPRLRPPSRAGSRVTSRPLSHGRRGGGHARSHESGRGSGRAVRSAASVSMVRTVWPATPCSRRWCSARGWVAT